MYKRNRRYIVPMVALFALAVVLSLYAWRVSYFPFDVTVTVWLQTHGSPTEQILMTWVSYIFGSWRGAILVAVVGVLFWWGFGRRDGLLIFLAGFLAQIDILLKILVSQPRPIATLVQVIGTETGFGFPSGHAMFAILFLGTITYIFFTHWKGRQWRIFILVVASLLILLIGVSRIYLGVHWLGQVIGSYVIGGIFLTGLIWLDQFFIHRSQAKLKLAGQETE